MKTITFYVLFLSLFLMDCTSAKPSEKYTTRLEPLGAREIKVNKDDVIYYEAAIHPSTGLDTQYEIADKEILTFDHSETQYKNKDKMEQGMTGADKATRIFAFKAKQTGKTTITFKEFFQGEAQQTHKFTIIVL